MKTVLFVLVVSIFSCCMVECGEITGSVSGKFNTGDAEFDVTLSNLNDESSLNVEVFTSDMSLSFGISKKKVAKLMSEGKMQPSDVYMALNIAKMTEKSLDDVVKEYKANRGKGWGVIAKRLGIKPGSKEFHALKNSGKDELERIKNKKGEKGKGKQKKNEKVKGKGKTKAKDKGRGKGKGKGKK